MVLNMVNIAQSKHHANKNGLLYSVLDIEFGLWYASLKNRTQHDVTGVSVKTSRPTPEKDQNIVSLVISDVRGKKLVIDYGHRCMWT